MKGNFARSILCSPVISVDFGWYSSIVGVGWLLAEDCSCHVIAARDHTSNSPPSTAIPMMRKVKLRRDFMGPLWFLDSPAYLPTGSTPSAGESSARIGAMPQLKLFRFVLLPVLGLVAGFLALAIAVPIEPQVPAPLISLFSPGLKLAEFVTPETGKSVAWTFGWFLRIAIAANAAFYYALFALAAYLVARRR